MKVLLLVIQELIEENNHARIDHFFKVSRKMKPLADEIARRFGANVFWEKQENNMFFSQISEKITATIAIMNVDE